MMKDKKSTWNEHLQKCIKKLFNKYKRNKFSFLTENDVRCDLYRLLSTKRYIMKVYDESRELMVDTSNIHTDVNFKGIDGRKCKPDICIFYTTKKARLPARIKGGTIQFLMDNKSQSKIQEKVVKRILIEIKITRSTNKKKSCFGEKIYKDIDKFKNIVAMRKIMLLIERSRSARDEELEDYRKKHRDVELWYLPLDEDCMRIKNRKIYKAIP